MNCIAVAALLFAASTCCSAAVAQQVEFDLDDVLTVGETQVAYGTRSHNDRSDSPTRIGLEALLDLRDFQKRLPDLLAEASISDDCGSRTDLTEIVVEAERDVVAVTGLIDRQSFECNRINETDFRRGAETGRLEVAFGAAASASLSGRCLTFELVDLSVDFAELGRGSGVSGRRPRGVAGDPAGGRPAVFWGTSLVPRASAGDRLAGPGLRVRRSARDRERRPGPVHRRVGGCQHNDDARLAPRAPKGRDHTRPALMAMKTVRREQMWKDCPHQTCSEPAALCHSGANARPSNTAILG